MSTFPIIFSGRYICDAPDYKLTKDCPVAQSGNINWKFFFLELWTNKLHTKRPNLPNPNSYNHYGDQSGSNAIQPNVGHNDIQNNPRHNAIQHNEA